MLSLSEINGFIDSTSDLTVLQAYYDKCYDGLKSMSKRSNQITLFLLILLALYTFSSYLNNIFSKEQETEILGFKISNPKIVTILTPLLCSYFIWEWCLLAKRRRSTMLVMKEISYKIFSIKKENIEMVFPYFNELSLNIMPFSFMIETLNVEAGSSFSRIMFWVFLTFNFVGIPTFMIYSIIDTVMEFPLTFPLIACDLISIYCFIWVVYFYSIDLKKVIQTLLKNRKGQ